MNAAIAAVPQKRRIRKVILTVLLISLGLHVAAGLVAGVVIVARYFSPPPAEFKVRKDIRMPVQEREHRMNMAAFDGMASKPSFNDKMQSLRPTAFALPDLPKVSMDQMLPLDPSAIVADQVSSMMGSGGYGSGSGYGVGGGTGMGTGFSFMGIASKGKRVLLLFDVSTSVKTKAEKSGVPLSKIREETKALLDQLPINARFGMIQFTQNYKPYLRELVPASDRNRESARKWLDEEWVEGGTMSASRTVVSNPRGILGVLNLAAQMQPDVIFLISDGSFQSGKDTIPWEEVKKIVKGPLQGTEGCKINFIGFQMKPEDRSAAGSVFRSTGGKMREIK